MRSYYKQHCENLRMIEKAIKSVQRTLREYISRDEETNVDVYTKILSHLINSWAEARVLKLVYENNAFLDSEKIRIIGCGSLKEKWQTALNVAFCKAYKISNVNKINIATIPYTPRIRYKALLEIINKDLLESYELRNRIAHGQWKYAFNNDLLGLNARLTKKLRRENIVKLQLKLRMFKSLAQIIQDLAVSRPTFERDFDNNFRKIEEQKRNFHNRSYQDYKEKMISKRNRGLLRARARRREEKRS